MKHLVLIAGIVYPNPSATGRCALDYVELLSDEFEIDVVYMSSDPTDVNPHIFNEKKYFPCFNWRHYIEQCFTKKAKEIKIYKVGEQFFKGIGRLQSLIMYPNNLFWFSSRALEQLNMIHKQNPIDVIFSVNSPFSAHLAAMTFKKKNPDIRWVSYTVDPYSSGIGIRPFWLSLKRAEQKEILCLQKADINFLSEELFENRRGFTQSIHAKALPYMLTFHTREVQRLSVKHFEPEYTNLVYAGSFYRDIRNPQKMLEVVYQLRATDIRLHIYSGGGCLDIIRNFSERPGSNIFLHSTVKHEELLQIYDEADGLVTIGNSNMQYSPSKIFEYISTGKPIIEFTYHSGNRYLSSYPMFLCVCDPIEDIDKLIYAFCHYYKGVALSSQILMNFYNRHLSKNIREILHNAIQH